MKKFLAAMLSRLTGEYLIAFSSGIAIGLSVCGVYKNSIAIADALSLCIAASVALGILLSQL